jgi:hypothetical protein
MVNIMQRFSTQDKEFKKIDMEAYFSSIDISYTNSMI